jgi:hypothetical protein
MRKRKKAAKGGPLPISSIYRTGDVFPREKRSDWSNVPKNAPSKRVTHINKWTHDYERTNGYYVTLTLEEFLAS